MGLYLLWGDMLLLLTGFSRAITGAIWAPCGRHGLAQASSRFGGGGGMAFVPVGGGGGPGEVGWKNERKLDEAWAQLELKHHAQSYPSMMTYLVFSCS